MVELSPMDWALASASDEQLEAFLNAHPELYCKEKHLERLKERKNGGNQGNRTDRAYKCLPL